LAKLEPVHNAGYQAGHHEKCLPGTRESVLRDILLWAKNPRDQNVFWLNGLAGTGKSTIAQSFSEAVAADGSLGASFFCSRDYIDRRELKNIFPTLAHQLACRYLHFRDRIVTSIKKDPTLAHSSLISQLENLLVNPLSGKDVPCVIVIDALDECIDDQPSSAILSVLGRFAKQLPLVKFFITGRPEPRIRSGFRLPLLEPLTQIFLLHGVELASVNDDIRLYLTQRLTAIAKQRSDLDLSDPWPHDNEITALTKKSSGLFIFASTLVRFVASAHHEPNERLQRVVSEVDDTTHEGRTGIDSLYSQVLLHAFSDVHEEAVFDNARRVLGAIVTAFVPLSRKELSKILHIPASTLRTTLRHLHSVVLVPDDETKEIRGFHKSFPDYLQNPQRCTIPRFYIDSETHHGGIALRCLELVRKLEKNPCSLPPFAMNQDVLNLPQLLEKKVGGAVRYACSYWARHLKPSQIAGDYVPQIIDSATGMLKNAPPWIEVMSLENRLEEAIHSMYDLLAWLDKVSGSLFLPGPLITLQTKVDSAARRETKRGWTTHVIVADAQTTPLHNLAMDCLRLLMHFFHPVQQCAQQVYHTALPLSPTSSLLRNSCLRSFADNQHSSIIAFSGAPDKWGSLLRTINIRPKQLTCIATFPQTIIAACEDIVNVYDAVTFVVRQSLRVPGIVTKIQGSSDGTTLFFAHSHSVTMWDIQTGGLAHTFTTQSEITDIAVSATGDRIACGSSDGSVTFWNVDTKEEGESLGNVQPVVAIHWLSPRKLAVVTRGTFYTHNIDAGDTSGYLFIPGRVWGMVYSPSNGGELLVGTSRSGKGVGRNSSFLRITVSNQPGSQEQKPPFTRPLTCSGEELSNPTLAGNVIACITQPRGVRLFDIKSWDPIGNPPPLEAATSVAVSLNRNLVAQNEDSIKIFSFGVLTSGEARDDVRVSHIYALGEKHIVCLQSNGHLAILELRTLRKLRPNDNINQSPFVGALFLRGFVAEFGVLAVMEAWRACTPLPEWVEAAGGPWSALSPSGTWIVTLYRSPCRKLRIKNARDGTVVTNGLLLGDDDLEMGEVYNITFDSENAFHLKVNGPWRHFQIPYEIIPSPSRPHSDAIAIGEPVPLLEPRATPPYTLDGNCEWVVNAEHRKICWIPPGNVRRGNGGHFWAGLSLVMVGDDGVVRKVCFREPDS
jgi:WD40 repeat protein